MLTFEFITNLRRAQVATSRGDPMPTTSAEVLARAIGRERIYRDLLRRCDAPKWVQRTLNHAPLRFFGDA